MFKEVLPDNSKAVLERLGSIQSTLLHGWTLAGGTGLSLQLGHRISEDLDFFKTKDCDLRQLHPLLSDFLEYETLQDMAHTLTIIALNTKLSFFCINDPFIFERQKYLFFNIAAVDDIALMKLIAISGRGSKKDFIDLYRILQNGKSLKEYLALLPKKYNTSRLNGYHILKSLTYFEDAEGEPMPEMLQPFNWEECKEFFSLEAHNLVLE